MTADVEQARAARIAGDKALLVMTLEHAKRHAIDAYLVATEAERELMAKTAAAIQTLIDAQGGES